MDRIKETYTLLKSCKVHASILKGKDKETLSFNNLDKHYSTEDLYYSVIYRDGCYFVFCYNETKNTNTCLTKCKNMEPYKAHPENQFSARLAFTEPLDGYNAISLFLYGESK